MKLDDGCQTVRTATIFPQGVRIVNESNRSNFRRQCPNSPRYDARLLAICAMAGAIALIPAIGKGQGFGGRGGGFFGGGGLGGATELTLISNPQVQEALEVIPSQVREIEDLVASAQEKMRTVFQELRDGGGGDRQAQADRIRERMTELSNGFRSELDNVLLPHQMKRLKQISFQQETRGRGNTVFNGDRLGEVLKLSDAQKDRLKTKAEEVEKKLRERVAKLRKEAEEELLSVLTPDQKSQYNDLAGDPFELQLPTGFGGAGGAAGTGAAGGGFGGGGGQGGRRGGAGRSGN